VASLLAAAEVCDACISSSAVRNKFATCGQQGQGAPAVRRSWLEGARRGQAGSPREHLDLSFENESDTLYADVLWVGGGVVQPSVVLTVRVVCTCYSMAKERSARTRVEQ
jgi:hypothetical protein